VPNQQEKGDDSDDDYDDDDDDEFDLFGEDEEEDEEERDKIKAERVAAYNAKKATSKWQHYTLLFLHHQYGICFMSENALEDNKFTNTNSLFGVEMGFRPLCSSIQACPR
jgi:hypothetical protein